MKEIRRLNHDLMNVLTSVNGFMELALAEPVRNVRFSHMQRAIKELRRAVRLAQTLRQQIEAKASQYGETSDGV